MARQFTVQELAAALGCEFRGDGECVLRGIRPIEEAGAGELTFLANPKYRKKAEASAAACLMTSDESLGEAQTIILAPNPYHAFAQALALFYPEPVSTPGVSPHAIVHPTATLGKNVTVHPLAVVDEGATLGEGVEVFSGASIGRNASIGARTRIGPNVSILHEVTIGKGCILHAGVVVGSDGFGFVMVDGEHKKIPQAGTVVIGDDVEIGANTTIDRGTIGPTTIGNNVKIDNLVQIAHNCQIGDHSIIVAQTGLSGSTNLGQYVTLAGQVATAGHLTIGDGVIAAGRAGITKDIPPGKIVSGTPAMDHAEWRRVTMAQGYVPELLKTVRELRRRVEELEAKMMGDE